MDGNFQLKIETFLLSTVCPNKNKSFSTCSEPKDNKDNFKTPNIRKPRFFNTTHLVEVDEAGGKGVVVLVAAVDVVDDVVVVLEKNKIL